MIHDEYLVALLGSHLEDADCFDSKAVPISRWDTTPADEEEFDDAA